MSEEELKVTVEGEEIDRDKDRQQIPADDPQDGSSEEAHRAKANADYWKRAAHVEKINSYHAHLNRLDVESQAEAAAAQRDMEDANFASHAERQRNIARIEAQRSLLEVERRQLERQPVAPSDPVEAFIAERDPATQAWLRAHPDDARALATGNNPRRAMKLNAADADAVAEGYRRGSKEYFEHVEKFAGMRQRDSEPRRRSGGSDGDRGGGEPTITVLKRGQAPVPGTRVVKMTQGEYEAATQHLTWGYDDPNGRFKKNEPIGVREYLRRRDEIRKDPSWNRLD
jgi:hypothetical protein